jgi:hypothetical protein
MDEVKETPKLRQINFQMALDTEVQEAFQCAVNVPATATIDEIAAELETLREAGWAEIRKANKRKLLRSRIVREERLKRIKLAKAANTRLDEKRIMEESRQIDTAIINQEAEAAADALVAGLDPFVEQPEDVTQEAADPEAPLGGENGH